MCVHTCTHGHAHTHVHVHTNSYTCSHTYTHHTYTHAHKPHTYMCSYNHAHIRAHTETHTCKLINTHTHTCTHNTQAVLCTPFHKSRARVYTRTRPHKSHTHMPIHQHTQMHPRNHKPRGTLTHTCTHANAHASRWAPARGRRGKEDRGPVPLGLLPSLPPLHPSLQQVFCGGGGDQLGSPIPLGLQCASAKPTS